MQVRNITHHCHSFSICPAGWGWRDNSNDMHTTKQHCPPTFTGTPPEHGPKSRCGALVAETPLRVEKMPCKASLRIPVLFSWRMAHLRFLRKQDGSSANSRTPQTQTPPPSASHDHFRSSPSPPSTAVSPNPSQGTISYPYLRFCGMRLSCF